MSCLGIDIGGKTVKFGLCEGETILQKDAVKTPSDFLALTKLIREVVNSFEARAVGIGVPGMVKDGMILNAPNLHLRSCDFLGALSLFPDPVLINDAEAALVAEAAFGGAKGIKNAVLLTIGTGIGGAILIDGKPYVGSGGAAEIGHMKTHRGGRCACGLCGCFETEASATAIERDYFIKSNTEKTARQIFELAESGDATAKKVVSRFISRLGDGILSLANILRPQRFILGGGVSSANRLLLSPLEKYVRKRDYGYSGAPEFDLVTARFTSDSGVIGAAEYARQRLLN